jgi:hypothetical protein
MRDSPLEEAALAYCRTIKETELVAGRLKELPPRSEEQREAKRALSKALTAQWNARTRLLEVAKLHAPDFGHLKP